MIAGAGRLNHCLKMLRERWDETKSQWSDQVTRDFEKNHLLPLEHQTSNAMRGMEKLSEVLSRLKQDCS